MPPVPGKRSVFVQSVIRREIYQTVASYNRLARAGFESAQEQERAMQATREKARALKRELDGVTQAQMKMAKTPVIPERGRLPVRLHLAGMP